MQHLLKWKCQSVCNFWIHLYQYAEDWCMQKEQWRQFLPRNPEGRAQQGEGFTSLDEVHWPHSVLCVNNNPYMCQGSQPGTQWAMASCFPTSIIDSKPNYVIRAVRGFYLSRKGYLVLTSLFLIHFFFYFLKKSYLFYHFYLTKDIY